MQRTLQWLYASKWAPNSSKYVCNSLSRLRCKLLKIQCGLNPVVLPQVSCQSVYGYHGHGFFPVYTQANVSYSAQNKDTCLLLVPFRSKCCHLDVPLLMNWAFAPQLGVLIPQRVIGRRVLLDCSPGYGEVHTFWLFGDSVNILAMRTSDSVISREYTYIFLTRWVPRSTLSKRCLHAVVHTTP